MIVYKFGGASLATADNFRNVATIIKSKQKANQTLVIVASALGKSTNKLEIVWQKYYQSQSAFEKQLKDFIYEYQNLIEQLFDKNSTKVSKQINYLFETAKLQLLNKKVSNKNYTYDFIVSLGELATTQILSAYLQQEKIENQWLDARKLITTNHNYRAGIVDFELTNQNIKKAVKKQGVFITQGFIGGTDIGTTTTLGREGSDYSAAIFAAALKAEKLCIWKDVEGVLTADPKLINKPELIKKMSYNDAKLLTYFGAKVIHPKTLAPLDKAKIPLQVRSFINTKNKGTLINENEKSKLPAFYILKKNQALVTYTLNKQLTANAILKLYQLADLDTAYHYMDNQTLILSSENLEYKLNQIFEDLDKNTKPKVKEVNVHVFYKQSQKFIEQQIGKTKILGSNQKGDFWVIVSGV